MRGAEGQESDCGCDITLSSRDEDSVGENGNITSIIWKSGQAQIKCLKCVKSLSGFSSNLQHYQIIYHDEYLH